MTRIRIASMTAVSLVAAILMAGTAAQAAEAVGLLSMVSGAVQIVRAGEKTPAAARTADLITAGDRVTTGRNSEAMFLYCPGSRAGKISADSDVIFQAATIAVKKGKLADERKVPTCRLPVNIALASATQQQSGMARTRGTGLKVYSPRQTNVATLQPLFRWGAVDNAKAYDVRVMDREERVLWKQMVNGTETRLADAKAIGYGQKYWWRVAALDGEETLEEVKTYFQVLPADQADQVRNAEAALKKALQETPADNGPRFLLAFLYEEHGMIDEAARTYGELADRMGPQDWVRTRLSELMLRLGWDRLEGGSFK